MNLEKPQSNIEGQKRIDVIERGNDTFSVQYERGEDRVEEVKDIVLERNRDAEGKPLASSIKIRFSEYLPEGWKFEASPGFASSPTFACDREKSKIHFPLSGLSSDIAGTLLLHEIGHAVREGSGKLTDLSDDPDFTQLARNEREAWDFALRTIRTLKLRDLVAEDAWGNPKLLRDHVYTALAEYEKDMLYDRPEKPFTKGRPFKKTDAFEKMLSAQRKEVELELKRDALERQARQIAWVARNCANYLGVKRGD